MSNAVILMPGLLNCKQIPNIAQCLHDFKSVHDDFKVVIHTWNHEYNDSHTFVDWFRVNFPKNEIYIQKETYCEFDRMVNKFSSSEFINLVREFVEPSPDNLEDLLRRHMAIYYSMAQSYMFAKTVANITDDTLLFRIKPNTVFYYNKTDIVKFFKHRVELGYRTTSPTKNNTVFVDIDIIAGDYPSIKLNENAFCAYASVWQTVFGNSTENFFKHTIQEIYTKHFDQGMTQYAKDIDVSFPFPVGSVVWGDIFLYHELHIKPWIVGASAQDRKHKKHRLY